MATLTAVSGLRLLETGQHSDFSIECQGRHWKVHKIVLGSISPYLDRVCNGDFRENAEASLLLNDEDPVVLDIVIKWLYTNTYIPPKFRSENDAGRILEHQPRQAQLQQAQMNHLNYLVKVYCCADRFLLDDLKTICTSNVAHSLVTVLTDSGPVHTVLEAIFQDTTSTDPLRAMVLEQCIRLYTQIQTNPLVLAVIKEYEPLCWDIGGRLLQESIEATGQNNANLVEVTRLTQANSALTKANTSLTHKVTVAEQKAYRTMWRLRNFLRDETVCSKCGCEITKRKMLIRLLHNMYAIDCQQCRSRVWYTLRGD